MDLLISGLLGWDWWRIVLFTFVMTHITIVAVTIFLHRSQAHHALALHPIPSHFFRFWLWLTTGMVTRQWVAIHRKHHARCETVDDPHSPQTRGIKTVLLTGSELYRTEAKNQATLEEFGKCTPDDWIEQHLYSRHIVAGIALMFAIDVLLFGVIGLTVWAVQMAWIPVTAAGIINGLGHWWGYRNFDPPDASTNISPWGVIIGGEELHNNHHTYPTSAKLSVRSWEFDIGWMYIRILEMFGLATVKRLPPRGAFDTSKQECDHGTVEAVVRLRYEVLSWFDRLAKKHHRDGVNWQNARANLIRLWKEEEVTGGMPRVYRSKDELLAELKMWLTDAEQSASVALKAFADRLRQLKVIRA